MQREGIGKLFGPIHKRKETGIYHVNGLPMNYSLASQKKKKKISSQTPTQSKMSSPALL